jgi:hypothetical protein
VKETYNNPKFNSFAALFPTLIDLSSYILSTSSVANFGGLFSTSRVQVLNSLNKAAKYFADDHSLQKDVAFTTFVRTEVVLEAIMKARHDDQGHYFKRFALSCSNIGYAPSEVRFGVRGYFINLTGSAGIHALSAMDVRVLLSGRYNVIFSIWVLQTR